MSSRASKLLATVTDDDLRSLMVLGPRYAPETIRKDNWVMSVYEEYCTRLEKQIFPYETTRRKN